MYSPRLIVGVAALATVGVSAASMRRAYTDRENGVSFSYPSSWLLNGDDDAATAKLRITGSAQPLAVVQLEGNFIDEGPYKGTDFEAGAFAYTVLPGKEQTQCMAVLKADADAGHPPQETSWEGAPASRVASRFSIEGTVDAHEMLAAYRNHRCYLFESVIVSKSPDTVPRPLTPERWKVIRDAFHSVMQSVHVPQPAGKS